MCVLCGCWGDVQGPSLCVIVNSVLCFKVLFVGDMCSGVVQVLGIGVLVLCRY